MFVASCPHLELLSPPHARGGPSAREPHWPYKTGHRDTSQPQTRNSGWEDQDPTPAAAQRGFPRPAPTKRPALASRCGGDTGRTAEGNLGSWGPLGIRAPSPGPPPALGTQMMQGAPWGRCKWFREKERKRSRGDPEEAGEGERERRGTRDGREGRERHALTQQGGGREETPR